MNDTEVELKHNILNDNTFKMGLTEETNYSQDTMTSILYVNHAGPKDVGKYRLPDIFYQLHISYLFLVAPSSVMTSST